MRFRHRMAGAWLVVFLAGFTSVARAQSSDKSKKESKGLTWTESFQGSSNSLGQVMKVDSSLGYNWNKYFGMDVGVPVYSVKASSTTTTGATSNTGLGNAYVDLRLTANSILLNYQSTLTGAAPTGDTSAGFSTGRATFDWNNHLDKTLLGFTPFVNAGVANTVSDTHFFVRPFSTLGLVAHFEGGITQRIFPFVKVGASVYDVLPTGQQKVFSKLIKSSTSGGAVSGKSHGAFQTSHETTGGTDLTKDNGYSAWINAGLGSLVNVEAGYDRSVVYDLNTISFGVSLNLSSVLKRASGH